MAGVVRMGDVSTGHGTWPSRPNIQASSDVFVNGLGVHRNGDAWAIHCDNLPICHSGELVTPATRTVFANGLPIGSVGDQISCADVVATGSTNVIVGM